MKTVRTKRYSRLMLRLRSYGSYIEEACRLEAILARKPTRLRIDMAGSGEIPPDSVLLIRSILLARSNRTHIITDARSSLQGAAVLVWLLGDTRLIREDARLYFRSAGPFESSGDDARVWKDRGVLDLLHGGDDLEEADYIRVLHRINEFLPVKELAGRPIELPVLRQFGLVDHEQVDRFLAAAFRKENPPEEKRRSKVKKPLPTEPDISI
jgi:hypothetical protein